jgi:uncharacterized protein (TIGR04255 family)
MTVIINNFQMEKVVFEVRYEHGYLYWDRCGHIWKELIKAWPNLKEMGVTPESAKFNLAEKAISLTFNKSNCNITQEYPDDLEIFTKISNDFISIVREYIEINIYKRVGNRFILLRPFDELSSVISMFEDNNISPLRAERVSLLGDKLLELGIIIRVGSDDINHTIKMTSISRNIEVSIPPPLKVDISSFKKVGLLFDIDIYTEKYVEAGILKPDEVVKSNLRRIQKLIPSIFSK